MSSHYIRIDQTTKEITHAFSSAFEKPISGDIEIVQDAPRHINMPVLFPKGIKDNYGLYNYKWLSNEIVEIPIAEKQPVIDYVVEQQTIGNLIQTKLKDIAADALIADGVLEIKDGKLKIKK